MQSKTSLSSLNCQIDLEMVPFSVTCSFNPQKNERFPRWVQKAVRSRAITPLIVVKQHPLAISKAIYMGPPVATPFATMIRSGPKFPPTKRVSTKMAPGYLPKTRMSV